tara:strand:+ start:202 stop:681 length:480 start_codon:yes stop_codon:yes gene_type:complete
MKNILIINIILFTLSGCNFGDDEFTSCNPMIPNDLHSVRVSYKFGYDSTFSDTDSFWYVLEVENNSDIPLENVKIKINHTWWGYLKDLLVDAGFLKGYKPFGETSFPANQKIQFIFSPDTQNNMKFTDPFGKHMNAGVVFKDIRIHTKQGVGTWRFPKP